MPIFGNTVNLCLVRDDYGPRATSVALRCPAPRAVPSAPAAVGLTSPVARPGTWGRSPAESPGRASCRTGARPPPPPSLPPTASGAPPSLLPLSTARPPGERASAFCPQTDYVGEHGREFGRKQDK